MRRAQFVFKSGAILACMKALLCYLDPGSGSLIAQLLIAIVVGILATLRFWKARLLSLFGIRNETDEEDSEDTAKED